MAVRSYAEVASGRDFQTQWKGRSYPFQNRSSNLSLLVPNLTGKSAKPCPSTESARWEVQERIRSLSIRLQFQTNVTEIERLRCDLFTLFFYSPGADLAPAKDDLKQMRILTAKNLALRKDVRNFLSHGLSNTFPPLVLDLIDRNRFAESLAIAKLMAVGADRDRVLHHICLGFASKERLTECIGQIRQITNRAFSYSTVSAVAEILLDKPQSQRHHFLNACKLLDTLPNEEKSRAMRKLVLKLARQGRVEESQALAEAIPNKKEKEVALLDIFETNHNGMDCLKLCVSSFTQCCQAIRVLFRRCWSEP